MRASATILVAAALMATAPCLALGQDTQATTVRYSVSATITFVDQDVQVVQKAPVGSTLMPPSLEGHDGYVLVGWVNQETGEFWDFDSPVPGDLTLVALYKEVAPSAPADSSQADAPAGSDQAEGQMAKTGDASASPLLPAALALPAVAASAVLLSRRRGSRDSR